MRLVPVELVACPRAAAPDCAQASARQASCMAALCSATSLRVTACDRLDFLYTSKLTGRCGKNTRSFDDQASAQLSCCAVDYGMHCCWIRHHHLNSNKCETPMRRKQYGFANASTLLCVLSVTTRLDTVSKFFRMPHWLL
jgi:hypothetical protein